MPRLPRFTVRAGDSDFYFRFGRELKQSEVEQIFDSRIAALRSTIFPGLVLQDETGGLWRPALQVALVPVEVADEQAG